MNHKKSVRSSVQKKLGRIVGKLRLKNMTFFGHHGVCPEERELGQRFEVDVEMAYEMARAAASDRVGDAINYQTVYEAVQSVMTGEPVHLLEALASRIAETVMKRFPAQRAVVRVRKLHPPIPGFTGYAEVEVVRER
ncbi:MAG: dihydroneopterin aldolase [Candidatus Latescibacteria bacterium]|nr:dihydroneopterin aldolase [Candidatus Latescibacterota bacterium]